MSKQPILVSVEEFERFGFYDLYKAQACILSACKKNLVTSVPLIKQADSQSVIVGRFYHDAMDLSGSSSTIEELQRKLSKLVLNYEKNHKDFKNLKKFGPLRYWEEITDSKSCAVEKFLLHSSSKKGTSVEPESEVNNRTKKLIGRVDYLLIRQSVAKIIELKSSSIRERDSGSIKHEYLKQIQYYAALTFSKYEIDELKIELRSLRGDVEYFDFSKKTASLLLREFEKTAEDINKTIRERNTFDDLTSPTGTNCRFCEKRIICGKFKERQTSLDLNFASLVVEGEVLEIVGSIHSSPIRKLKINDLSIGKTVVVVIPRSSKNIFNVGDRILIENLRIEGDRFKWGDTSRVYE